MNDKPIIAIGMVIALVVLTVPFWYALAAGTGEPAPELALPEGQCVEPDMAAHHMEVLNRWRDEVVRKGDCSEIEVNGKKYAKSLTKGCMSCHESRQDFCKKCHDYADVRPTCWDCHVESLGK